jgi:transcriptional regulator with PAS, ATPase and Fis domain
MARVEELIALVSKTTIPVLVLGETGSGKGLVAEAIHQRSARAGGPFVRINCAALSETLLETELFGHERGAFTGAHAAKRGLLEAASGGTVFLDEAGDMPAGVQAKLLHALEQNEVMALGALKPRSIDVRFVAATNRDVAALVAEGRLRQDLYFRLNGVTIRVPPLRERPEDIASLARAFVEEASARMNRPAPLITDEAMKVLVAYPWPGNVRELRNAMVRASLFAAEKIGVEHFDLGSVASVARSAPEGPLHAQVRDLEKQRIVEALQRCGNNQVETAKVLGIARGTLRSRMKELGLLPK